MKRYCGLLAFFVCMFSFVENSLAVDTSYQMEGDYIKTQVDVTSGTFGLGTSSPGMLFDQTGSGDFVTGDGGLDYLTYGTPKEGFYLNSTETGNVGNDNSDYLSPQITKTSVTSSSSIADNYVSWTGKYSSGGADYFTITNQYYYDNDQQNIAIKTTITALTDLTNVQFLRVMDPDPASTTPTLNAQGNTTIAASDLVSASKSANYLVIGLYSDSSTTHNTGVSSTWSDLPSYYLTGANSGDGDYTIGIAFNIGSLLTGDSIELMYYYVFGNDIDTLESPKGTGAYKQIAGDSSPQTSIAAALDEVKTGATGKLADFLNEIDSLPTQEEKKAAIDALRNKAPEASAQAGIASANIHANHVGMRMNGMLNGGNHSSGSNNNSLSSGFTLSDNYQRQQAFNPDGFARFTSGDNDLGDVLLAVSEMSNNMDNFDYPECGVICSGWITASLGSGRTKATEKNSASDNDSYSVTAGVDTEFGNGWIIGGGLGYTVSNSVTDDDLGGVDSKIYSLIGYGAYATETGEYIKLVSGLSYGNNDYTRNVTVGSVTGTATGKADTYQASFTVGGGKDYIYNNYSFGPTTQLQYIYSKTDGYTEEGLGTANYTYDDDIAHSLTGQIGVRGANRLETAWGSYLFRAELALEHQFANTARSISTSFESNPNVVFGSDVAGGDLNYVVAGLGTSFIVDDVGTFALDYEGTLLNHSYDQNYLILRMRVPF